MLKILNNEVEVTTEIPDLEGKYVVPVLDLVSNHVLDNLQYRIGFDTDTAVEALSFVDRIWVESLKFDINDVVFQDGSAILYLIIDPNARSVVGVKSNGQIVGNKPNQMIVYWVDLQSPYLKTDFGCMYGFSVTEHQPVGRVDQLIKKDRLPDDLDRMFYAKSPFIVADKSLLLKSNLPKLGGRTKRYGGRNRNRNEQHASLKLEDGYYLGSPDGSHKKVNQATFKLMAGEKFVVFNDGEIEKF